MCFQDGSLVCPREAANKDFPAGESYSFDQVLDAHLSDFLQPTGHISDC